MTTEINLYQGPNRLNDDVQTALKNLNNFLSFEISEHDNHSVIQITGLDQRDDVVQGIAVYLTGAVASCIEFNMSVRAALFNEETLTRDLYRDVERVIGQDNNIDTTVKTYERNPWIWEGICHLMFHLSLLNNKSHPPDLLLAKSSIHLDVKDHGLDIIALYGTEKLGVTAGECKAYLERPASAITDAANRLEEVDSNSRDAELRAALSQFRSSIPPDKQDMLVGTFWLNERAYFPMICCEITHSVDWSRNRRVLERLNPPSNRKFLVPAAINGAESFFDAISETMRQYAYSDAEGV